MREVEITATGDARQGSLRFLTPDGGVWSTAWMVPAWALDNDEMCDWLSSALEVIEERVAWSITLGCRGRLGPEERFGMHAPPTDGERRLWYIVTTLPCGTLCLTYHLSGEEPQIRVLGRPPLGAIIDDTAEEVAERLFA
jgi:hypothetical protein